MWVVEVGENKSSFQRFYLHENVHIYSVCLEESWIGRLQQPAVELARILKHRPSCFTEDLIYGDIHSADLL